MQGNRISRQLWVTVKELLFFVAGIFSTGEFASVVLQISWKKGGLEKEQREHHLQNKFWSFSPFKNLFISSAIKRAERRGASFVFPPR